LDDVRDSNIHAVLIDQEQEGDLLQTPMVEKAYGFLAGIPGRLPGKSVYKIMNSRQWADIYCYF
jgi:hypothetical protein